MFASNKSVSLFFPLSDAARCPEPGAPHPGAVAPLPPEIGRIGPIGGPIKRPISEPIAQPIAQPTRGDIAVAEPPSESQSRALRSPHDSK